MTNTLLISFVGSSLIDYNPKVSKEWVNSYTINTVGFTPNKGQIATNDGKEAKEVIFYTRNKNLIAYITEKGISYVLYSGENFSRVDYELIGAKIQRNKVEYYDELPGYENYYLAHCPNGILFVRSYKRVVIRDIYENIDWVFRYDEFGNLHHEFMVKKGGDLADIRIKIKNAKVSIRNKEIEMKTPVGLIIDGKLVAYRDGRDLEISYNHKEDVISFIINGYDGNGNLIIDPQISLSDYQKAREYYISNISIDKNDNVYIVGSASSPNFPVYNPEGGAYFQGLNLGSDAFIIKFSSNGVILWATYYGGTGGDAATSISIDNNNNVYVVGRTNSHDFPVYDIGGGAYFQERRAEGFRDYYDIEHDDIFILKFNSKGIRLWATYYGGDDYDFATSTSIDKNNNIYVVGWTSSTDFPLYNPGGGTYFDESFNGEGYGTTKPFILKFNSNGVRLWATYYGGERSEIAYYVSVDNNDNVYVVGTTHSTSFPVYDPEQSAYFQGSLIGQYDAFILKFNSKGERLWATYYGGSENDAAYYVHVDKYNNVYVVGYTSSGDFPVYDPRDGAYFQEAGTGNIFILKFNSNGERLWATCYGGGYHDYSTSITIDNNNNLYVVGYSFSDDFPIYNPGGGAYFQESNKGDRDAFIVKFNSKGLRVWSTYYGGSDEDYAFSVFKDSNNNIYIVGETKSTDFPVYDMGEGAYFQEKIENNYHSDDYEYYQHSNAFILKFNSKGERLWATYLKR